MGSLLEFVRQLLETGEIVFHGPPEPATFEQHETAAYLGQAFELYRLDVAGQEIAHDADIALAAARFVRWASWFLVSREAPPEFVTQHLTLPPPHSAAQHLSGDMLLRFLPQLQRRARSIAVDDALTNILTRVLREWPLSGILSDVPDPPLTRLDFDEHVGLKLLYAERLANNEKADWFAPWVDQLELVYHELGKPFVKARVVVDNGATHDVG
jgi:hypothetical protein